MKDYPRSPTITQVRQMPKCPGLQKTMKQSTLDNLGQPFHGKSVQGTSPTFIYYIIPYMHLHAPTPTLYNKSGQSTLDTFCMKQLSRVVQGLLMKQKK